MNIEYQKIEQLLLRCIALVALNVIAFIYDGQWITFALGTDAIVLGLTVRNGFPSKEKEKKTNEQKSG